MAKDGQPPLDSVDACFLKLLAACGLLGLAGYLAWRVWNGLATGSTCFAFQKPCREVSPDWNSGEYYLSLIIYGAGSVVAAAAAIRVMFRKPKGVRQP